MVAQGGAAMSDSILLSEVQMRRIEPYFPLSHGIPRVNDRRIISGIIFVIRNGLRWRDAPKEYGPHKTIYNRFIRWSRLGVFSRILAELTARRGKPEQLMIDATHLKAHRTAASLLKKGMFPDVSGGPQNKSRELKLGDTRICVVMSKTKADPKNGALYPIAPVDKCDS
jgi:putative transposase